MVGPKKLPELARAFGKSISEFKKGTREVTESVKRELDAAEAASAQQSAAAQPGAAVQPKDQPSEGASGGATPPETR
ncbi:twin arginine translocase protein A [compost metagenome]